MSSNVYLYTMVGVILLVFGISVPSLIRKKCPKCKTRNSLDAAVCKTCGNEFPKDL